MKMYILVNNPLSLVDARAWFLKVQIFKGFFGIYFLERGIVEEALHPSVKLTSAAVRWRPSRQGTNGISIAYVFHLLQVYVSTYN